MLSQLIGVTSVAVFVVAATSALWLVLKKTIGIRVSPAEELEGLDISEHGNIAYPDFAVATSALSDDGAEAPGSSADPKTSAVPPENAVSVVNRASSDSGITKVTIITNPGRLGKLEAALDLIGITGLTVENVIKVRTGETGYSALQDDSQG